MSITIVYSSNYQCSSLTWSFHSQQFTREMKAFSTHTLATHLSVTSVHTVAKTMESSSLPTGEWVRCGLWVQGSSKVWAVGAVEYCLQERMDRSLSSMEPPQITMPGDVRQAEPSRVSKARQSLLRKPRCLRLHLLTGSKSVVSWGVFNVLFFSIIKYQKS